MPARTWGQSPEACEALIEQLEAAPWYEASEKRMRLFMRKLDNPFDMMEVEPCVLWTAATYSSGYGAFHWRGRSGLAHRFTYEAWHHVQLPRRVHIDHLCRVRGCVNPNHLEPVSQRTNNVRQYISNREAGKPAFHPNHWHFKKAKQSQPRPGRPGQVGKEKETITYANQRNLPSAADA